MNKSVTILNETLLIMNYSISNFFVDVNHTDIFICI